MPTSKDELTAAMHRIADALRFMRGPSAPGQPGDLIYVGERIPDIAWHLARAGVDVHPERAVIKARPVPDRPGQFAGMIDWVPVDWEEPEPADTQPVSALAPDIDLTTLEDKLPWHVRTKIQGAFE